MSATASNGGGSVSLESSVRTCKVDTGWANKVQSDRFQNPSMMVCPTWNGMDSAGRFVCPDSFYTKRAGCNSAEDRVMVENNVSRPQYMEYVNLNANGIAADIYGNTLSYQQEVARTQDQHNQLTHTGQFGNGGGFGGEVLRGCCGAGSNCKTPYEKANPTHAHMAQKAHEARQAQALENYYYSAQNRAAAGF